jgi:uncharacterized membrane protein
MSKRKNDKRKSIKNVAGLVLFSAGIGMSVAILMPGMAATFTLLFIGTGGYILFIC